MINPMLFAAISTLITKILPIVLCVYALIQLKRIADALKDIQSELRGMKKVTDKEADSR